MQMRVSLAVTTREVGKKRRCRHDGVRSVLTCPAYKAYIGFVKLVYRILARTIVAVTALALIAPLAPASDSADVPLASGGPACCTGVPANAEPSACRGGGVEMLTGGMCASVCTGVFAFIAHAPSCHSAVTQHIPGGAKVRLKSHHTAPDPFPPKIPLTS